MATFLINSAEVAVKGTETDDTFEIFSGGNAVSIDALGGDDSINLTSAASGGLTDSFFFLRDGDDTVDIQSGGFSNGVIGGGPGDDSIFVSGTAFNAATVNGGRDDDYLDINVDNDGGNPTASGFSINGGRGDDTVILSADGVIANGFLGAGKDDDSIVISADDINSLSVAGGLGEDTIDVIVDGVMSGVIINGGGNGTDVEADSADSIFVSADYISNSTVLGNGGDDSIYVNGDSARGLVVNGNRGDDSIYVSANSGGDNVIGGGKGDDTIEAYVGTATTTINGGAGEDSIFVSGGSAGRSVVFGGADADSIFIDATAGEVGINSFSDSTLAKTDNVKLDSAVAELTVASNINDLTVFGGTFVESGGTTTAVTAGFVDVAALSAGVTSLTAAVEFLDGELAEKETIVFEVSGGDTYLFGKGTDAESNLVMEVQSAGELIAINTTTGTDLEITFS